MSAMTLSAAAPNRNRLLGLGTPLLVLALLGLMVLPMKSWMLDLFFTFNIALSLVVILMSVYTQRPLDFSVFPSVLLVATLLRLALNVASTRIVLLYGHTGTDAAGRVIESFGEFVMGGNYAVGLAVFAILVIINFVVVTKGAGRVSEVSARFTLDAMPGKQMAIDADLNAGLLTAEEAKARRAEIGEEADFYGSMDGASKFVRGDAIAGILILFINIIGGLAIGTLQQGMDPIAAANNYVLLTIGDGLVAQIPSLVLSSATAIIVTRVSASRDLGEQVATQLLSSPRAFFMVAGIIAVTGVVPGMPTLVFLALAAALAGIGYGLRNRARAAAAESQPVAAAPVSDEDRDLSWDDVPPVDLIGLELGYRLIPLVDNEQGGKLLPRIKGIRRKLSQELGFLFHPVHIRDNLELSPTAYRISLLGVVVGEGEVMPDRDLAINPGRVYGAIDGQATRDPAYGLEAVWIDTANREKAQSLGYTVVDAATVVATHVSRVLKEHAHELLGHEEAQQLIDVLAKSHPKLVENLVPSSLELGAVLRVLKNLLAEEVPVRDMRSIAEALAHTAVRTKDADELTAAVRLALGRSIVQRIIGNTDELPLIALDATLEQILHKAVQQEGSTAIEPELAARLVQALREIVRQQERDGIPSVLVVSPEIRHWISGWLRASIAGLNVLAYTEIPDNRGVKVIATVGPTTLPSPEKHDSGGIAVGGA
jgi:flagellar biosynthesis protein FlhA